MELYEITLHFPDTYGSLNHEDLILKNTDYYKSAEDAIAKARTISEAFVTPRPDFWFVEGSEGKVWSNDVEAVKRIIYYDLLSEKPQIIKV